MASEQRVRRSRELRKNLRDDVGTLSRGFHATCSLKDETDKQLSKLKKMHREVHVGSLCLFSAIAGFRFRRIGKGN